MPEAQLVSLMQGGSATLDVRLVMLIGLVETGEALTLNLGLETANSAYAWCCGDGPSWQCPNALALPVNKRAPMELLMHATAMQHTAASLSCLAATLETVLLERYQRQAAGGNCQPKPQGKLLMHAVAAQQLRSMVHEIVGRINGHHNSLTAIQQPFLKQIACLERIQ